MKLISRDYSEVTGITTEYWSHPGGKRVTVRRYQDSEPLMTENARQLNSHSQKGRRDYGEGVGLKIASIPPAFIEQYMKERGVNLLNCTDAQFKRFLNDPEYRKFRTAPGRV